MPGLGFFGWGATNRLTICGDMFCYVHDVRLYVMICTTIF